MAGIVGSLVTTLGGMGGGFGKSTAAANQASQLMDNTMAGTTMMSAQANAQKLMLDTQNSILDGQMDSATKETNSAHNAAKALQF